MVMADLWEVDRIANLIHVELPERREVFAEKLRLFSEGCFALEFDGVVVGYGISRLKTNRGRKPSVQTLFGTK